MPFRIAGFAVLFTLMLLTQTMLVTADIAPMPTKTPFDLLPTKTAIPAAPPTKTLAPIEPSVPAVSPTVRPILHATPTVPRTRIDRTATPKASPWSTPIPTHRRPVPTAMPLPSATLNITESTTPIQTQTRPPQLSLSPIFNVISSSDSSTPILGFLSLIGLIGLALLQHHIWACTDLRLRRAVLQLTRRTQLIIDDEWIMTLLNQVVFHATGQDLGLDQIERVLIDSPAIVGLGCDFQRVIFTPAPVNRRALIPLLDGAPRRLRAYPIDARHGDLFVTDDLAAAYRFLCRQNYLAPSLLARLARCDRWLIYLVPPPDSHSQRR